MKTQHDGPVAFTPREAIARFCSAALDANRALAQIHEAARDGSPVNMAAGFRRLNGSLKTMRDLYPLVLVFAERASGQPVKAGGMIKATHHQLIYEYSHRLWSAMIQAAPPAPDLIRSKGIRCAAAYISPILGAGADPFSFDPRDIATTYTAVAEAVRRIEPIDCDWIAADFRLESARAEALAEAAEPADATAAGRSFDPCPSIAPTPRAGRKIKEPSELAIATYRLHITTGLDQAAIAKRMEEETRIPFRQPKVSRFLKDVNDWLAAGNILPDLSKPQPKTIAMDPAKLEQGRRRDGRTGHG